MTASLTSAALQAYWPPSASAGRHRLVALLPAVLLSRAGRSAQVRRRRRGDALGARLGSSGRRPRAPCGAAHASMAMVRGAARRTPWRSARHPQTRPPTRCILGAPEPLLVLGPGDAFAVVHTPSCMSGSPSRRTELRRSPATATAGSGRRRRDSGPTAPSPARRGQAHRRVTVAHRGPRRRRRLWMASTAPQPARRRSGHLAGQDRTVPAGRHPAAITVARGPDALPRRGHRRARGSPERGGDGSSRPARRPIPTRRSPRRRGAARLRRPRRPRSPPRRSPSPISSPAAANRISTGGSSGRGRTNEPSRTPWSVRT
ncbi:hypothetical protein SANTM175S_00777 [Streptomyces antimycoticus]